MTSIYQNHPNYWVSVTTFALIHLALGLNFLFLHPTFLIFDVSNWIWGVLLLAVAAGQTVCLHTQRVFALRAVLMAAAVYMALLGAGASEPFLNGEGSLQLPIMYVGLATLLIPLITEPPMNPLTMLGPRPPGRG